VLLAGLDHLGPQVKKAIPVLLANRVDQGVAELKVEEEHMADHAALKVLLETLETQDAQVILEPQVTLGSQVLPEEEVRQANPVNLVNVAIKGLLVTLVVEEIVDKMAVQDRKARQELLVIEVKTLSQGSLVQVVYQEKTRNTVLAHDEEPQNLLIQLQCITQLQFITPNQLTTRHSQFITQNQVTTRRSQFTTQNQFTTRRSQFIIPHNQLTTRHRLATSKKPNNSSHYRRNYKNLYYEKHLEAILFHFLTMQIFLK